MLYVVQTTNQHTVTTTELYCTLLGLPFFLFFSMAAAAVDVKVRMDGHMPHVEVPQSC